MARRRRRPNRRASPARRSRYRERLFTVTCSVCGEQVQVPVQPPHGVALTCVNCLRGDGEPEDAAAEGSTETQGAAK